MDDERFLDIGDVTLCVQTAGRPDDPAVLLLAGASSSMVWWDEAWCERLAEGGRFVVRYDQRDTGRSTTFPVGQPGYAMSDLATDAVGILDGLGIERGHVVGQSMAGGTALFVAVDHPERVLTVTFVSTTTGDESLPPPSDALSAAGGDPPPMTDTEAMIDYVVAMTAAYIRPAPLDEAHVRALATLDVDRTTDMEATLTNHFAMDFDQPRSGQAHADIAVPALVIHGDLDPCFPVEHGRALQRAIPGADLVVLPDAGHVFGPEHGDAFVAALLAHTAPPR